MVLSRSPNVLKAMLADDVPQFGLWCSLADSVSLEVVAGAGFDWLLIDVEHSPNDLPLVLQQLQTAAGFPLEPVVRLPNHNADVIKQFLDIGARSLLLPMVETPDQAAKIVRATRYPPGGIRGYSMAPRAAAYGRSINYHAGATEDLFVVAQIESPEAAALASDIAAVEGIDALFVGPGDLSANMGHLSNPAADDVQQVIRSLASLSKSTGKPLGILTSTAESAGRYADMGYRMIGAGTDVGLLRSSSDALIAGIRTTVQK